MKKMNKFFKNQDGLSIVSVIGSIAVLGVGLVAAINLSKMSKKGEDSAVRKVDAISLTSTVVKKLKSVFLDTKTVGPNSASPKLTSGLCS